MTRGELSVRLAGAGRALNASGLPWALVGGMAVVVRARLRPTEDVDLLVEVGPATLPPLLALLEREGFAGDDAEMRTLMEGGLVQLWGPPDRRTGIGLDLLFADDALSREVLRRATPVEIDGVPIPVASPEDLILMKLDANRPTDLDDVIALRDAFDASLDRAYLARMAMRLGIEARVQAFIG